MLWWWDAFYLKWFVPKIEQTSSNIRAPDYLRHLSLAYVGMLAKTIPVILKSHLNCCSLEWECLSKENALVGTKSPWVLFKEKSPGPISENRFAPFCFDWQQTHHFLVVETIKLTFGFLICVHVFGFSCSQQFSSKQVYFQNAIQSYGNSQMARAARSKIS